MFWALGCRDAAFGMVWFKVRRRGSRKDSLQLRVPWCAIYSGYKDLIFGYLGFWQ